MENLVNSNFEVFKNKKVFITGNTGFKGTWLELWLRELGSNVKGFSLDEEQNMHHKMFSKFGLQESQDILDCALLQKEIIDFQPDIIYHLAAQSLVPEAYEKPFETWETNLVGTANLLRISMDSKLDLKGLVIATSDKVYDGKYGQGAHTESDILGGGEPYSASKAACELLISSMRNSRLVHEYNSPKIVTVRAGNVIGGGDFNQNRLFPDILRSIKNNLRLEVRMPEGIRPWQHVLDCLSGYLFVGAKILNKDESIFDTYNIGPEDKSDWKVRQILQMVSKSFPDLELSYQEQESLLLEREQLRVDSSRALNQGWKPKLSTQQAIEWTIDWYEAFLQSGESIALDQLHTYVGAHRF